MVANLFISDSIPNAGGGTVSKPLTFTRTDPYHGLVIKRQYLPEELELRRFVPEGGWLDRINNELDQELFEFARKLSQPQSSPLPKGRVEK